MNLLIRFLREPQLVAAWGAEQWNVFLPLARSAGLLGRCLSLLEQHQLLEAAPPRLVDQLQGALNQTRYVQGQAMRELRAVTRIMAREKVPLLALKGVAYLAAGLPPSGWRNLADIDLLVPEQDIDRAERALLAAGWVASAEFDSYDQHYYRDWMHEIPPLVHRDRQTEVDLHHNLAPPVSRIRIDAALLWEQAETVSDAYGLTVQVLSPPDILLHNAVHLFMNDELRGGLRDVVDFRDLFEHFARATPDFEQRLLARSRLLGCNRPLYYAVSTAHSLLRLKASPEFLDEVDRYAPAGPKKNLMAWLFEQVLAPRRLRSRRSDLANQLLFVRSHWVRMPPGMLLRHLLHKLLKPRKPPLPTEELPG
jgi:hypothetical protein